MSEYRLPDAGTDQSDARNWVFGHPLVREQARHRDSATDLASREAKLEEKVSRFMDPAA
jgi:hypothetical protein